MSFNTIGGSIEKTSGRWKSLALALVLCLSLGEVYGQSTSGESPRVPGDTLHQRQDSLLFGKPEKLTGLTIMKHTNSPLDQLVNDSIHTQYPDFKVDFIESGNTILGVILREKHSSRNQLRVYRIQIEGKTDITKLNTEELIVLIKAYIEKIQSKPRDEQRPLTAEEIEQLKIMKEEAAKDNTK